MKPLRLQTKIHILGILATSFLLSQTALAQWVVISSGDSAFKPGMMLDSSHQIRLEANAQLKLLSRDGKTLTLKGPYSGEVSRQAVASGNSAAFTTVANFLQGQQQSSTILGTVRSLNAKPPSHELISSDISGSACILSDTVNFWRKDDSVTEAVSIVDKAGGDSLDVTWKQGQSMLSFPAQRFTHGHTYDFQRDALSVTLTMNMVTTPLLTPLETTAWLMQHDCKRQAKSLLESL